MELTALEQAICWAEFGVYLILAFVAGYWLLLGGAYAWYEKETFGRWLRKRASKATRVMNGWLRAGRESAAVKQAR